MSESNFGMGDDSAMMQPFGAFAEMQRRSLEQTRQMTHDGFELQKRLVHATVEGVESQQSVQESNSELARASIESAVSAMQASIPNADVRSEGISEMVSDQLDAMDEMSDQAWETLHESMEENTEAYDALVERYAGFFDDSFELYIEALEEIESDSTTEDDHESA